MAAPLAFAQSEEQDPEYLTRSLRDLPSHSIKVSEDDMHPVQPSPSLSAVPQAKEGYRIRLLSGNANKDLSLRIAESLGLKLESAENKKFVFVFVFCFCFLFCFDPFCLLFFFCSVGSFFFLFSFFLFLFSFIHLSFSFRFADGEINLQVHENVRGADVYIIQPMCPPNVNDNIM